MERSSNKFSKIVVILATIINIFFFIFLFRYNILPQNKD